MIKPVSYDYNARKNLDLLAKGAFLTTQWGNKVNTMVIGWGSLGVMWRLPVFNVMVRQNRYTYELLEKSREFTVTFPYTDLRGALEVCGTRSGRQADKLAECGLETLKGQKIPTPVLKTPGMHFECKVVYGRLMADKHLDKALNELWYNKEPGDYHVFYVGEIVASYLTD